MKRIWIISIFVIAVVAATFGANALFRYMAIANRPDAAVVWWLYKDTFELSFINKIPVLNFFFPANLSAIARYELWAADSTGDNIWLVRKGINRNAINHVYDMPKWALIKDNHILLKSISLSMSDTQVNHSFVSVYLRDGRTTPINTITFVPQQRYDSHYFAAYTSRDMAWDNYRPYYVYSYITCYKEYTSRNEFTFLNPFQRSLATFPALSVMGYASNEVIIGESPNKKTIGSNNVLVTTRFEEVPGFDNAAPWNRTSVIDFSSASSGHLLSRIYVFTEEKDGRYIPYFIREDELASNASKISLTTSALAWCVIPPMNDGNALLLMNTMPGRGSISKKSDAFIAKVSIKKQEYVVMPFPEEIDRFRPSWNLKKIIYSWYNADEDMMYVMLGPNSYYGGEIYTLDTASKCNKIWSSQFAIHDSVTLARDGSIWYLLRNNGHTDENPSSKLIRFDRETGEEKVILENTNAVSLHGPYLGGE